MKTRDEIKQIRDQAYRDQNAPLIALCEMAMDRWGSAQDVLRQAVRKGSRSPILDEVCVIADRCDRRVAQNRLESYIVEHPEIAWPSETMTVRVDPQWIDYLTNYGDIFGRPHHAGYWLAPIEHDERYGWLAWEHNDENVKRGKHDEALVAWRDGKPLPDRYFRLDPDAAMRAWVEGVKLAGTGWYEKADGPMYDRVVQLALLGEERYG